MSQSVVVMEIMCSCAIFFHRACFCLCKRAMFIHTQHKHRRAYIKHQNTLLECDFTFIVLIFSDISTSSGNKLGLLVPIHDSWHAIHVVERSKHVEERKKHCQNVVIASFLLWRSLYLCRFECNLQDWKTQRQRIEERQMRDLAPIQGCIKHASLWISNLFCISTYRKLAFNKLLDNKLQSTRLTTRASRRIMLFLNGAKLVDALYTLEIDKLKVKIFASFHFFLSSGWFVHLFHLVRVSILWTSVQ